MSVGGVGRLMDRRADLCAGRFGVFLGRAAGGTWLLLLLLDSCCVVLLVIWREGGVCGGRGQGEGARDGGEDDLPWSAMS